ncbi:MAG TPA: hypothetical protein VHU42_04900 [Rhodopila sp.]|nr:hypothetical protein [Rhodopila sp.]
MIAVRTSRGFAISAVLIAAIPVAAIVVGAFAILLAGGARASAAGVGVRSGNHPGFGRVVIDTTGTTAYTLDQDGDHVVVHLPEGFSLGAAPAPPRNVIAIRSDGSTLDLVLRHGVQLHPWRKDGRVIIDLIDDPAAAAPRTEHPAKPVAAPRPHVPLSMTPRSMTPRSIAPRSMASSPELGGRSTAPAPAVERASVEASNPPAAAAQPAIAPPIAPAAAAQPPIAPAIAPLAITTIQPTPPGRDVMPESGGPLALRARRIKLPKEMDGTAFIVPFDSAAGAAAFSSGDSTYIVFDERRPVDMAALAADPVFGSASVRMLPTGTLIQIPHPAALSIALTQLPQGWRITALANRPKRDPIVVSAADGRLNLAAEQSGDVVNMADPDTGATLLVGTQHRPGQAVTSVRRGTEFILRRTDQGVVVEPLSDAIALKQAPAGFTLSGKAPGLMLSPPTSATAALMDAANLTRRFNFATIPAEALLRLSVRQLGDAAATPPLARGPKHHAAAETLMALGLSAEAESLLHMATDQDPKEAASADTAALTAIAALLAGRPAESGALADPRLSGTDEIALWRAVRQAVLDEGSPNAAAVFATTAPLVFQYPPPIRDHILPLVAETMIQGGEVESATRLLNQHKTDPGLAYARALLSQAEGDTRQALTMLDALASGRDQYDRARAAVRAAELRLATGALDKAQAADALDKLLYAWRGDARELALRERVADLRGQTGNGPVALSMLRQAEADFPEQAPSIHQRLKDAFAGMIRDQDTPPMPPITFVAMVEENTDLVPDAGDGEAMEQSLADRLLALDLPVRAKPVLEKLLDKAKSGTARARFGTSLATLDAREGDDAGALAALDASQAADLPVDLTERRLILRAGSIAHRGDPTAAAALLAPVKTAQATEARAQMLETASDWAGAAQAWSDCAGLTLPAGGPLDEAQVRTVLRLATATARAGDEARLADLREKYGPRIGAGPLADMFRLLTAEPIRGTADIGRSQRETNMAVSLPAGLKALQPTSVTR